MSLKLFDFSCSVKEVKSILIPKFNSFAFKAEYDNLIQTLNQLSEEIKILQSDIDTKDAAITSLEQAVNECPNIKTDMSMVIVIPSSDEIDDHGGKIEQITVKNKFLLFYIKTKLRTYYQKVTLW